MSLLNPIAFLLRIFRKHKPQASPPGPRILVIRRNRLGDMINTLPLLHALRRHFSKAHIAVACDPAGAPIARACAAVDEVIVLERGWFRGTATLKNAARLQDHDWVLAAKGGFDRRLATLARLTNGAIRIGFERRPGLPSSYYTDPVAPPGEPNQEHQIETLLRLLRPLGLKTLKEYVVDLSIRLPEASRTFAAAILAGPPFAPHHRFVLINLSSTVRLKFRDDDFIDLATRVLAATDLVIGFVAAPDDQDKARLLAAKMATERVAAIATPGPLDLAALLDRAAFLVTPEGGAAHLAATVHTPALVLWSEGPFQKWRSRGPGHAFVEAKLLERTIPVERVWEALRPFLAPKVMFGIGWPKATGGRLKIYTVMFPSFPSATWERGK